MEGRQLASPPQPQPFGLEPLFSPSAGAGVPPEPSQWRRDEHARFVQALETVGAAGDAAWAQIAAFVGSRSVGEARRHGQQYLARLMQQPPRPGAFDWVLDSLSDAETPSGGYASQNDPGNALATASGLPKPRKAAAGQPQPQPQPQPQSQLQPPPRRAAGRRPKTWTFQEDKAFETALAGWASGRPYSWAKIAAAVPGKSAKDVRGRYEKLLGDVSAIEGVAFSALSLGDAAAAAAVAAAARQRPPPIAVTPQAAAGRLGLLSPTLFDLLDAPDARRESADGAAATPRVWSEFLADAFKFDEPRVPEPPSEPADVDMGE